MAKSKISPSDLENEVYTSKKTTLIKIMLIATAAFFIGLLSNFPVKENIALLASNAIKSSQACPIRYEKIEVSFFLPAITIKDTNISGKCFKNSNRDLSLNDVPLMFYGPSFSPIGLKFKSSIKKGKSELDIFISVGFGSQSIRVSESKIDSSLLNTLTGSKFSLGGLFNIDAVFNIEKGSVKSGNLYVKSSNLSIPGQNISGFDLPHLSIENLLLKADIKPIAAKMSQLNIITFEIGANDSPILGQLKGPIKLNFKRMSSSEISLKGKVKFSKSFIESFGILNLFLGGKSVDDEGFYQLRVDGNFKKPSPKFL